ncbi:MAG: T9SS type A sorting domain-containing protein, partial [Bacteroidales bacterium]|nr:T9SS type A sorting domain-containing protein [Bacteroidales bacterium]
IAYSGEDLLADSLLVYYSINGTAYQTASFAASADEDEFVAYIQGYESGDTVDYYVFAKDETGRRLMQPYTGAFDPHQFVVEEQQITELTITPDTLYYINEYEDYLILKNETANPVTVLEVGFDDVWWFDFYDMPEFPFVIAPDESVEIMVVVGMAVQMNPTNYMYANIEIATDIGDYKVPVKINIDLVSNISEAKQIEAQVYPNPFDQQLNIRLNLPQSETLNITLTDLSGRIVEFISANAFEAGEHQLQMAAKLAKGIYFLKISDGKQQQIIKVIKQ